MRRSKATIDERVAADLRRGDMGLARQRLAAQAREAGYSSERLARVAQISFQMHDLYAAGRFWLLTECDGPDVESAIAEFVRRCGRAPTSVASQLPLFARLTKFEDYPPLVRERLRALGLQEAVLKPAGGDERTRAERTVAGRALELLLVVTVLAMVSGGVAAFVVGCYSILNWVIGRR